MIVFATLGKSAGNATPETRTLHSSQQKCAPKKFETIPDSFKGLEGSKHKRGLKAPNTKGAWKQQTQKGLEGSKHKRGLKAANTNKRVKKAELNYSAAQRRINQTQKSVNKKMRHNQKNQNDRKLAKRWQSITSHISAQKRLPIWSPRKHSHT